MRYYLAGPGDTYAEEGAAPAPVPGPGQTTVVQGGAVQAGAFAPMRVVSTAGKVVEWVAAPGKQAMKAVTKAAAREGVSEEYIPASEQAVSAFYKTPAGKVVVRTVAEPIEKGVVKAATAVVVHTGIEEAWSKLGTSALVKFLSWLGKGAVKVAPKAAPVVSIAGDLYTIGKTGVEVYRTAEAQAEAARQSELSYAARVSAYERAKAGQDRLLSEKRLMDSLPFVIGELEYRRNRAETKLRDTSEQIAELQRRQAELAEAGQYLSPAETRLLWDKINQQNTLTQQVWLAAAEMARVQAMPPSEKALWLDDLFAKNPGLKAQAVAADVFK